MKILITGITGLFGSYLAREFSSFGEIHGLRRKDSSLKLLEEKLIKTIHWHECELSDSEGLEAAVAGMDLVIHSAGKVSFDPRDQDSLYKVNVEGTANIVNIMLSLGVKKLIYVSSVSAIGRSSELNVIDENFKWTESPLNSNYAISKYLGELEAWRGEQEGLDLIVVNPSILLAKINDAQSSAEIYQYVLEEHKYYPKGDLNYIDIRDAAKQVKLLLEKEAWGERFILSQGSISYREFFERVARVLDKKAPSKQISPQLLNWVVFFNTVLRRIGLSKSPLNKTTAKISQQKLAYDSTKINSLLNFSYTPLEETLNWAK